MRQIHLLLYLTSLVPVAVSFLNSITHKYDLIMTPKSWTDAQNYCRMMYNDLATVISDADWLRLNKEAASKGLATPAWVGLYDDYTSWRWSLNELPLKNVPYTNWYSGQPNNAAPVETCVLLSGSSKWFDLLCTYLRAFICYNASFSGADKFMGIKSLVTWHEARAYCRTYHTDLASSLNSSDQIILGQIKAAQGDSWIGLYRDAWKWSDGTVLSNIPWATGQPDNSERIMGSCGSVNNGLFSDERCTNLRYFFCHTTARVRSQTVKLQVKSDGSVFDPVVQSSILELIKQTLEQKGLLETIKVTWRVQPDGSTFYKKKKSLIPDVNCLSAQSGFPRTSYTKA